MLSLIGAMVERNGEAKTEEWARGVVNNMARAPKGGDTDQIRAVATGECGIALTNTYYFARMMRSRKPEDESRRAGGVLFPNQATPARTSTSRAPRWRRTRRIRRTRRSSSNTWLATRRRSTSLPATTSGRP